MVHPRLLTRFFLPGHSAAQAKAARPFEFPDGYNSSFSSVRLTAPEIIFNPSRFLPQQVRSSPRWLLIVPFMPSH